MTSKRSSAATKGWNTSAPSLPCNCTSKFRSHRRLWWHSDHIPVKNRFVRRIVSIRWGATLETAPSFHLLFTHLILLVHFLVRQSFQASNATNPLSIPHAVGGSSSATFEHCLFVRSTKFSRRLFGRAEESQSTAAAAASSKAETALDRNLWTASTGGGSGTVNGAICEKSSTAPTV